MATRAIADLHVDTQVLERRLLLLDINEAVSYADLNTLIGRDVQRGARHILASARNRLLSIHGRVTDCITNEGIKRLDDVGIVGTGEQAMKHIHRTARRSGRKLAQIQHYDLLSKPDQSRLNLHRAMFGMMANATTGGKLKKLEARVGAELAPSARMLAAMQETL